MSKEGEEAIGNILAVVLVGLAAYGTVKVAKSVFGGKKVLPVAKQVATRPMLPQPQAPVLVVTNRYEQRQREIEDQRSWEADQQLELEREIEDARSRQAEEAARAAEQQHNERIALQKQMHEEMLQEQREARDAEEERHRELLKDGKPPDILGGLELLFR